MNGLIPVIFRFPTTLTPKAQRVSLVGPFNDWNPNVHPLTRAGDYWWIITAYFPPGRVVYAFDVDGTTWLDPNDTGRIPNGWGSEYSVRNIEPIPGEPSSLRPPKHRIPIAGGAQVFEWCTEELPEATILRPFGEVDPGTVSIFRDALMAGVATGRSIIVDISGIDLMDRTGTHALLEHAASRKAHRGLLILVAPNGTVQKIMEITSLYDAIPTLGSIEEALDLLRARLIHRWPTRPTPKMDEESAASQGRPMESHG